MAVRERGGGEELGKGRWTGSLASADEPVVVALLVRADGPGGVVEDEIVSVAGVLEAGVVVGHDQLLVPDCDAVHLGRTSVHHDVGRVEGVGAVILVREVPVA